MLEGIFKDNNILLILVLFLVLSGGFGGKKGHCGDGGIFGGDNILLILVLFLCLCDVF